jgi:DNA repair protein RadC
MKCDIRNNAGVIIVSHQYPSGDSTPSKEDIEVTKRLAAGGWILGVDVLDHVIVSHTGKHVSLKGL